jgi:hypothetical protein
VEAPMKSDGEGPRSLRGERRSLTAAAAERRWSATVIGFCRT